MPNENRRLVEQTNGLLVMSDDFGEAKTGELCGTLPYILDFTTKPWPRWREDPISAFLIIPAEELPTAWGHP